MNSVRIVADSGCDLSPALADEYKITIIPVFVRFGQEMVPSDHLTNDEFWRAPQFRVSRPARRRRRPVRFCTPSRNWWMPAMMSSA